MRLDRSYETFQEQKDRLSVTASRMLAETGLLLMSDKSVDDMQIHFGHDVHGFYGFSGKVPIAPKTYPNSDENIALHVQAYPGMSSDVGTRVMARLVDKGVLSWQRREGVSIGNEHDAVLGKLFRGNMIVIINHSSEILAEHINDDLDSKLPFMPE